MTAERSCVRRDKIYRAAPIDNYRLTEGVLARRVLAWLVDVLLIGLLLGALFALTVAASLFSGRTPTRVAIRVAPHRTAGTARELAHCTGSSADDRGDRVEGKAEHIVQHERRAFCGRQRL